MTIDTMFRQTDFYSLSGPPGPPAGAVAGVPGALGPAMHEPSKVLDFNYNPHRFHSSSSSLNNGFNQPEKNNCVTDMQTGSENLL